MRKTHNPMRYTHNRMRKTHKLLKSGEIEKRVLLFLTEMQAFSSLNKKMMP